MPFTRHPFASRPLNLFIGGESTCPPPRAGQTVSPSSLPAASVSRSTTSPAPPEVDRRAVSVAVEADLHRTYERAHDEGYAAGFEAGRREGMEQAQAEFETRTRDARHELAQLLWALRRPLAALRTDLVDAIIDAALHVAGALVGEGVTPGRDALKDAVARVLAEAGEAGVEAGRGVEIRVCPSDRDAVEAWVDGHSATVIEDASLVGGDVRATLRCNGSDGLNRIDWDGSLERRWNEIRHAIHQNPAR